MSAAGRLGRLSPPTHHGSSADNRNGNTPTARRHPLVFSSPSLNASSDLHQQIRLYLKSRSKDYIGSNNNNNY